MGESESMYASIDRLADAVARKLGQHKEKKLYSARQQTEAEFEDIASSDNYNDYQDYDEDDASGTDIGFDWAVGKTTRQPMAAGENGGVQLLGGIADDVMDWNRNWI